MRLADRHGRSPPVFIRPRVERSPATHPSRRQRPSASWSSAAKFHSRDGAHKKEKTRSRRRNGRRSATPQRRTCRPCRCHNSRLQGRCNVVQSPSPTLTLQHHEPKSQNIDATVTMHRTCRRDRKRWLAEEVGGLALQYSLPQETGDLIRFDGHDHMSRRRVALDARNHSPRTSRRDASDAGNLQGDL